MSQSLGNPMGVVQNVQNSRFEFKGISWIHYAADPPVPYGLSTAIEAAGEHRHAARHGLQIDDPETLTPARHDEGIGQAIVIHLFRFSHEPGEDDMAVQAKVGDLLLEPRTIITITRNQ